MTHTEQRIVMNESEGHDEAIRPDGGIVINITIDVVYCTCIRHNSYSSRRNQQIGSRLLMEESGDGSDECSDSDNDCRDEAGAPDICTEDQEQIVQGNVHDEQLNSNSDDQEMDNAPTPCTNGHDAFPIVIHNSYIDDYVGDE